MAQGEIHKQKCNLADIRHPSHPLRALCSEQRFALCMTCGAHLTINNYTQSIASQIHCVQYPIACVGCRESKSKLRCTTSPVPTAGLSSQTKCGRGALENCLAGTPPAHWMFSSYPSQSYVNAKFYLWERGGTAKVANTWRNPDTLALFSMPQGHRSLVCFTARGIFFQFKGFDPLCFGRSSQQHTIFPSMRQNELAWNGGCKSQVISIGREIIGPWQHNKYQRWTQPNALKTQYL